MDLKGGTVWLVWWGDGYGSSSVEGVFGSYERAQAYIDTQVANSDAKGCGPVRRNYDIQGEEIK